MKGIFVFATLLLTGCSHSNIVDTRIPDSSVVVHATAKGYEDRYQNTYDDFKDYPVTCTGDCYPPNSDIVCESAMQDCQYIGTNPELPINAGFTVKWLGHASFLVSTENGQQVLFDPVFAQFDWPVNWAFRLFEGFNRQPPAALSESELSDVNAVMYSHIHYDHFNKGDIQTIGNKPDYLVPLGFAEHFPEAGYHVTEMAWYASKKVGDITVHFVPAHHFSSRILVPYVYDDSNATLWGGWVLEQQGKTLFFAGDTGYSPHFKDIAAKFGSIDVCLLPIASYYSQESPDWYRKVHTTPEDALMAADDLDCKVIVPWGYGNASWRMGDISSHSALFRLLHMTKELKSDIPLVILNEGQQVAL